MAEIDLTAVNAYPWIYTLTVGTTWRKILLPSRPGKLTVIPEGEQGFLAFDNNGDPSSVETPEDDGAVGTHRIPVPADGSVDPALRKGYPMGATNAAFVARSSTSGSVTLILEL
jgi:hypothetical protein